MWELRPIVDYGKLIAMSRQSPQTGEKSPDPPPTCLTAGQAGSRLGVSLTTLARWRAAGEGPPWITLPGDRSVRYDETALTHWIENRTREGAPAS